MRAISLLALLFLLNAGILACQCYTPDACQAYSEADAVFIGELVKVGSSDRYDRPGLSILTAEFRVEKTFKGLPGKSEIVEFAGGGCEPNLVVGKKFFVYKRQNIDNHAICDRTRQIEYAALDIEYAKKALNSAPYFTIGGRLNGLHEKDLEKVNVRVISGGDVRSVRPDKQGFFQFISKRTSDFGIEIFFSDTFRVETVILGTHFPEETTRKLVYEAPYTPNGCDFRTFNVGK